MDAGVKPQQHWVLRGFREGMRESQKKAAILKQLINKTLKGSRTEKDRCGSNSNFSAATLLPFSLNRQRKRVSISANPLFYLVEAAGLEPASEKPTLKALHA